MGHAATRHSGLLQAISPCLKHSLLGYGVGVVLAFQALAIVELVFDLPLEWIGGVAVALFVAPALVAVPIAVRRGSEGTQLRLGGWLPNMLAMLAFAGFGYFLVADLARSHTYWSLELGVDRAIPEVGTWVFFYLTVYFVYAIPLVYLDDLRQLAKLDIAQVATMLLCWAIFIAFPVATVRTALPVVDVTSFTLATVRQFDPPWNCFPSTHCTVCTVASLAVWRTGRKTGLWLLVSTLFICISTLLTKQHYVLDVLAGVVLGSLVWWAVDREVDGGRLVNAVAGVLARLNGKGGTA